MRKNSKKYRSRREFFVGILRYAALGLMATGSAALFAKRQRLVREGKCMNDGICSGCEILQDCSLPRAITAKQTEGVK